MVEKFFSMFTRPRQRTDETKTTSESPKAFNPDSVQSRIVATLKLKELSSLPDTHLLFPEIVPVDLIKAANIFGASADVRSQIHIRASLLAEKESDARPSGMDDVLKLVSQIYDAQIEQLKVKILAHYAGNRSESRAITSPIGISVHSSDLLIAQAIIHQAILRAADYIKHPKPDNDYQFDNSNGDGLIIEFDSKFPGKSEHTNTGKTVAALQDNHQRPINGTHCAADLLVIAAPNSYQKSAGLAGENLSFFRATTSKLDTPQGHRPLVVYATNDEQWDGNENQVLVPTITREQWQENFIPSWLKETNLIPTIEKIAGESFSRLDTLITVGTLSQARMDWEGGSADFDKQFAETFKKGEIPPAILKQMAINLIKFGTNYQFAHLKDQDNLDKSLQKLLGMAKYMNDQGTYDDRQERLQSLALLNISESNAIEIAKDMAREIYPMASYAGIQFEFKSNGLFTVLRLLNNQDITVAKGVLTENVAMDRVCGYCGVIILSQTPSCPSCGGPGKEFYWKPKKVVSQT